MILERMRDSKDYMCVKDYNIIAFDLREDASLVKSVVEDFGLFEFSDDGKHFYSKSFLRRMKERDAAIGKLSASGRLGAQKRWGKTNDAPAKKIEESTNEVGAKKEEEIHPAKTKEDYARQFIEVFNAYIKAYKSKIRPVVKLTDKRADAIMMIYSRFAENGGEYIKTAFKNAVTSDFCNGNIKGRNKPADFDWIIKPENFLRCLEGNI